jgi:hypothetical protein
MRAADEMRRPHGRRRGAVLSRQDAVGVTTTTRVALSWSWRQRRAGAADMRDTFISTICASAHRREDRPYLKKYKC